MIGTKEVKAFVHILIIVLIGSLSMLIYRNEKTSFKDQVIVVGGDTLGRNWDNLPSAKEIEDQRIRELEQAGNQQYYEAMPQQEEATADNFYNDYTPTTFSDKAYREQTQTIVAPDGREVVVSSDGYY
ncbi:MAG: hypothetical protein H6553_11410 [Chitinophagales bacterium]|nr:hypothetical protein [Chitinophagales bacterium]